MGTATIIYLSDEAKRNRLINGHAKLVAKIAGRMRSKAENKGIFYEDLVAEARLHLVNAARKFPGGSFADYAATSIFHGLERFIQNWEEFVIASDDAKLERDFYEWGKGVPYELWVRAPMTPEDFVIAAEEMSRLGFKSVLNAIESLKDDQGRRDVTAIKIMRARFFRNPIQDVGSIARENKVSYRQCCRIIKKSLETIKELFASREAATPTAMRG